MYFVRHTDYRWRSLTLRPAAYLYPASTAVGLSRWDLLLILPNRCSNRPHQRSTYHGAVGKSYLNVGGPIDNMVIGDNIAFRIPDKSGTFKLTTFGSCTGRHIIGNHHYRWTDRCIYRFQCRLQVAHRAEYRARDIGIYRASCGGSSDALAAEVDVVDELIKVQLANVLTIINIAAIIINFFFIPITPFLIFRGYWVPLP